MKHLSAKSINVYKIYSQGWKKTRFFSNTKKSDFSNLNQIFQLIFYIHHILRYSHTGISTASNLNSLLTVVMLYIRNRHVQSWTWREVYRGHPKTRSIILWLSQRYIQNPVHVLLLECTLIWHFYLILSMVYFFPRTQCRQPHMHETQLLISAAVYTTWAMFTDRERQKPISEAYQNTVLWYRRSSSKITDTHCLL